MREKLKEARKQHGYTQKSFSEKIGISVRTYQHIEQGSRFASENTLMKIMCELETNDISLFKNTPKRGEK